MISDCYHKEYESYFSNQFDDSEEFFSKLPDNYKKLYRSYLSVKEKNDTEKQIKTLYRERILQLKENRSITDYRICKIFGINNGNFHAFLYQGKTESISLDRIRSIYDYLSKTK